MFFREKKTSKCPVLQLVETHRDAKGKVRQRMVVSLGGCRVPDEHRKAVAIEVTHRMAGYQRLFPLEDPEVTHWTKLVLQRIEEAGRLPGATFREVEHSGSERAEEVCVDAVEHEQGVELGPALVLFQAWKALGLDGFFAARKFSPNQIATAKVSVLNRLIEPCSENELVNWVATTALDELLNVQAGSWGEDRFYRISDKLLAVKEGLETHLREQERSLFNLDRTILLYDLTNSYFEGAAEGNELARRSANSKEKRTDCPLISVGVVLDAEGFVITHKVFTGNTSDCRTLLEAVADLEKVAGEDTRPVVVLDGGMATGKNLERLADKGYDYVVNGKRQKRAKFAADFLDKTTFKRVEGRPEDKSKQPVFVRRLKVGGETVVLCRSDGRRDKEDAIQDSAQRKLIEGLEKLEARILRDDPRLKLTESSAMVNRAVGRLASRTTRASKLYEIHYEHETRTLTWNRREGDWTKDRQLHGCYHLRSSLDMSDQQLWKLYITLTRVEDAFRHMKSDLGLRPFHHQMARRCRAHIWITILAYHLLRWTEFSLQLAGYECTWRALRRKLQTHCYATVIVPTATGLVHHARKPGRPNEVQRLVYSLLGIEWMALPVRCRTYRTERQCAKT
ncbi:MAG: IS1634 family transposase [Planctomycetes bacterium]|nr:IS1634 family transposase [Planctomycetota bacterium]